jgi:hypothetical protein
MAESSIPDPHAPSAVMAATASHDPHSNSEVRYERSDIAVNGVLIFVGALIVLLIVSGIFLTWLFYSYENRQATAFERVSLPLAGGERNQLPSTPRLEGIDPNEDVGRYWPAVVSAESPPPWFGYNVRVVSPDAGHDAGDDAEERDRRAVGAMARKLQKIDAKIGELAGKLPVRQGAAALPPDTFRSSAGESNGGRPIGEKSP